ncbi:ABC-three component system middle component 2 [Yaniella sp.]|uniref:ABC-three component system middle component 2 n=1 Tax=Yaniella sp. TaxID=2773929 RepID=UPI0034DE94BF
MRPLNSPLEVGLRAVIVLTEAFPNALDMDRLLLMDYVLLHSGDFGGPDSLQPPLSTRGGELGAKREILNHGLQMMMRAGMVDVLASSDGITYRASEAASPFLQLVRSNMLGQLSRVARWVVHELSGLSDDSILDRTSQIERQWSADVLSDNAGERFSWTGEEVAG